MAKRSIQDIVPGTSRSIRNIPLPENRRSKEIKPRQTPVQPIDSVVSRPTSPYEQEISYESTPDQDTLRKARHEFESHNEDFSQRSGNGKKYSIIGLSIVGIIGIAFLVSNIFHSATINLSPRTVKVTLNDGITASKANEAIVPFTTVTVETVGSQKVPALGEEKVNRPATGTIIIYNNYNSTSQRLVKNTRFETPEGLIYRITDSVTVPGKNGSVPGSVEALVVAESTGDSYNVGLKDFTIPGFKNDPRFETFYARSKTALQGGFIGIVKVVADADRLKAQNDIKNSATTELIKKLDTQKPANSVSFDNAYIIDCALLEQETVSDKEALIKMNCSLSAAVFDMQKITGFIANKYVSDYKNEPIVINNIKDIIFTPKDGFSPDSINTISFTLTGDAIIEWTYNEKDLKEALAGKKRSEVPTILQAYPMVEKADISVRPAWRRSIPSSVDDISVIKSI